MERVFLSLGSNLGDRVANLNRGISALSELVDSSDVDVSQVYESEPWGRRDQPWFLNCVMRLQTERSADSLLDFAQGIEATAGRNHDGERWGPRALDIDILMYGDQIIRTERLIVPHPQLLRRKFVLIPLLEFPGNTMIAGTDLNVSEALTECRDTEIVRLYREATS